MARHECLDAWSSEWNETPRLDQFGAALGTVESTGARRPIVEIHNNADGNCLLSALGFYLCVSVPEWNDTIDDLRRKLLDDIEVRLMDTSPEFDADRMQARVAVYTAPENDRWAQKVKSGATEDAMAKYVFVRRREKSDLGELELDAFSRVYKTNVRVWSTLGEHEEEGVMMTYSSSPPADWLVAKTIPNFGGCVHLRFYSARKHFTLFALLDPGSTRAPGFGLRPYV